MSKVLPSQIVSYLTAQFREPIPLGVTTVQQRIGAVAGFLELYDAIPSELIQLVPSDYANLIAAIGTIRFGLDQYRNGSSYDALGNVGRALNQAWPLIKMLPDSIPSLQHDLSFISDITLRDMIGLDLTAISSDLHSGEWKGATILSGSCSEALLLYGLQTREINRNGTVAQAIGAIKISAKKLPANNLLDHAWDLHTYAQVAQAAGLISVDTNRELDSCRNYRNLIHPAKSVREGVACDRGTAYIGVGAVEHVIRDLRKNL